MNLKDVEAYTYIFPPQLVTIRRTDNLKYPPPTFLEPEKASDTAHTPAHKDFREKYFQGFKKEDNVTNIPSDDDLVPVPSAGGPK